MNSTPPFWADMTLDERALAVRAAAHHLIAAREPAVRRIGYVLLQAVLDGEPKRLPADLGLIPRGGIHSIGQARALEWRDRELRRLARSAAYDGLSMTEVARSMITSFATYERRNWPRDREAGRLPGTDPDRLWASFLLNETRLPRTLWRVRELLTPERPFGSEGARGI
ncbi:MAG: hypothetical protein RL268_1879 [Pseudomonadota bacterium]|jgi:hypothetical protein